MPVGDYPIGQTWIDNTFVPQSPTWIDYMRPPQVPDAEEQMRQALERMQRQPLITMPSSPHIQIPTLEQFERLLFLLSLTNQERAFVQAAASGDRVGLLAFADWLIERGRDEEAEAMIQAEKAMP